jgi:hypothetical protein
VPEKGGLASVSIGFYVHAPMFGDQPVDFINKAYNCFVKAKELGGNLIISAYPTE